MSLLVPVPQPLGSAGMGKDSICGELAALKRLLRSGGVPTPLPSSFHASPGLPPKQLFQSFNG